jgi:hypothetical protein
MLGASRIACTMLGGPALRLFVPNLILAASAFGFLGTNHALLHPSIAAKQRALRVGAPRLSAGYRIPHVLACSKAFRNNNQKEPSRQAGLLRTFAQLSEGESARNTGDSAKPGVPALWFKQALLHLLPCDKCFFFRCGA